jgi:hypothetical protein
VRGLWLDSHRGIGVTQVTRWPKKGLMNFLPLADAVSTEKIWRTPLLVCFFGFLPRMS